MEEMLLRCHQGAILLDETSREEEDCDKEDRQENPQKKAHWKTKLPQDEEELHPPCGARRRVLNAALPPVEGLRVGARLVRLARRPVRRHVAEHRDRDAERHRPNGVFAQCAMARNAVCVGGVAPEPREFAFFLY